MARSDPCLLLMLARFALAALCVAAAIRCPSFRIVARGQASLAIMSVAYLYGPPWAQQAVHVAWPGVLVAMAWGWAWTIPFDVGAVVAAIIVECGAVGASRWIVLASRLAEVVAMALLLARRRPRTWPEVAAATPLAFGAVGVVAGAWPTVQAGWVALRASWWLAEAETHASMALVAVAVVMTFAGHRRRGPDGAP